MARVILNKININKKLSGALTKKRFIGIVANAAESRFNFKKEDLLRDFDNSEITQELMAGATSTNSVLPYGNLAAFLGLEDSAASTSKLRAHLKTSLKFDKRQDPDFKTLRNGGAVYAFRVEAPTLEEIYAAFPPPPKSYNKSWISVIENGYGTFAYFVFRLMGFSPKANSRSGTGIQREGKRGWDNAPRVDNMSPKFKWISKLFKDFMDSFRG